MGFDVHGIRSEFIHQQAELRRDKSGGVDLLDDSGPNNLVAESKSGAVKNIHRLKALLHGQVDSPASLVGP